MGFNFNIGFNSGNKYEVEKDNIGNFFYTLINGRARFKELLTDAQKLDIILRNPACLKVFKLNSDLFTLGKVYVKDSETTLKQIQKRPNKHQTWNQWFWDYNFYYDLGTALLWRSNNTNLTLSETNFYWLNPAKLTFSDSLIQKLDKMTLSNVSYNELEKETVRYTFADGTIKNIPLKEIQPFCSLSNTASNNWYKSNSVIDALFKVISNVEETLDAKNINTRYSGKFGISGQQDPDNVTQLPMGEDEKKDIETKIDSSKKRVHAFKSKVDINRFVSDMANLKLDDSYLYDLTIIGSMLGIPKAVLDSETKSKGLNANERENALSSHVSYSLQPKADNLMEWLSDFLGIELYMTWEDLPFMQASESERATTLNLKAEALNKLITAGIDINEAKEIVGL